MHMQLSATSIESHSIAVSLSTVQEWKQVSVFGHIHTNNHLKVCLKTNNICKSILLIHT